MMRNSCDCDMDSTVGCHMCNATGAIYKGKKGGSATENCDNPISSSVSGKMHSQQHSNGKSHNGAGSGGGQRSHKTGGHRSDKTGGHMNNHTQSTKNHKGRTGASFKSNKSKSRTGASFKSSKSKNRYTDSSSESDGDEDQEQDEEEYDDQDEEQDEEDDEQDEEENEQDEEEGAQDEEEGDDDGLEAFQLNDVDKFVKTYAIFASKSELAMDRFLTQIILAMGVHKNDVRMMATELKALLEDAETTEDVAQRYEYFIDAVSTDAVAVDHKDASQVIDTLLYTKDKRKFLKDLAKTLANDTENYDAKQLYAQLKMLLNMEEDKDAMIEFYNELLQDDLNCEAIGTKMHQHKRPYTSRTGGMLETLFKSLKISKSDESSKAKEKDESNDKPKETDNKQSEISNDDQEEYVKRAFGVK